MPFLPAKGTEISFLAAAEDYDLQLIIYEYRQELVEMQYAVHFLPLIAFAFEPWPLQQVLAVAAI